jgi:DNA-binding protein HU-beta
LLEPSNVLGTGRETIVNKTQFIEALAERFDGNRKEAEKALESVLDTITREVVAGEKVSITGFGSFEKRTRNARWVRNPQTGERIKAKKKTVPRFAAGQQFKDVTSGAKKLAPLPKAPRSATAKKATKR